MLQRLRLRSKLSALSIIPIIALVVLASLGYKTFQTVKVNGPEYKKVAESKDLEADILPPPAYLVETHLIAALLGQSLDITAFNQSVETLKGLEADFKARHEFWQTRFTKIDDPGIPMKSAYDTGIQYYETLDKEFVPTLRRAIEGKNVEESKKLRAAADVIFKDKLAPGYAVHRRSINVAVRFANERQNGLERTTATLIEERLRTLKLTALGVAFGTLVLAFLVTRSIRRPIEKLTKQAMETAERGLPAAVARIQAGGELESDSGEFFVGAGPSTEIGALGTALDSMRATALGLASEQAVIRRNVSDNLVNVARRNQILLKRALSSISGLEKEERDPTRLERLFTLDHMVTRMRRNAESLLVLAGSEGTKLWNTPMIVGDVVRASLSQIESYGRVDFSQIEVAHIKGQAVTDVSHLLAEFLENATHFSPPTSRVTILGRQRLDGYMLTILDDGVGMTEDAVKLANERLAQPSAFASEATKVLGLTVAGHLAARYKIKIQVGPSPSNGVAVQIWLPSSLLQDVSLTESSPAVAAPASRPVTSAPVTSAPVTSGSVTSGQSAVTASVSANSLSGNSVSGNSVSANSAIPVSANGSNQAHARAESFRPAGAAVPTGAGYSSATAGSPASTPVRSADPTNGLSSAGQQASDHFELPRAQAPIGTGHRLARRIPGAQLPVTGNGTTEIPDRDAANVRASLSSFQRGVKAANDDRTNQTNPTTGEMP